MIGVILTLILMILQIFVFAFCVRSEFENMRCAITMLEHRLRTLDLRVVEYLVKKGN